MNVLSLFDGMSCGQIALQRAGIKVDNYFASEIDKEAIKVTMHNYPGTIQLGDVRNVSAKDLPKIDLLLGGSPCQGFSFAGKQLAFDDPRSALFFEYVRIWREIQAINPDAKFLLENVRMKREHEIVISKYMGIAPVEINSNLVSAQNRPRVYWTNIAAKHYGLFGDMECAIPQPKDRGILLKDILEKEPDECHYLSEGRLRFLQSEKGQRMLKMRMATLDGIKAQCLTARSEASWNCNYVTQNGRIRRLSPIECERLQCVSDNYTSPAKLKERYKMLGNGWTIDVIVHILSYYDY